MDQVQRTEAGLDYLALFSPRQVDCIMSAVQRYGIDLPHTVEVHQVEMNYINNPFGAIDPVIADHKVRGNILRSLGLIWKDALTSQWTKGEYVDMLKQSTGCSEAWRPTSRSASRRTTRPRSRARSWASSPTC